MAAATTLPPAPDQGKRATTAAERENEERITQAQYAAEMAHRVQKQEARLAAEAAEQQAKAEQPEAEEPEPAKKRAKAGTKKAGKKPARAAQAAAVVPKKLTKAEVKAIEDGGGKVFSLKDGSATFATREERRAYRRAQKAGR